MRVFERDTVRQKRRGREGKRVVVLVIVNRGWCECECERRLKRLGVVLEPETEESKRGLRRKGGEDDNGGGGGGGGR